MASKESSGSSSSYPPLNERPLRDTVCLFDVDGTLTPARRPASPEILEVLSALRQKCAIAFVGGSNLVKQQEQLGDAAGVDVTTMFDFCFAENGLTAYRMGVELPSNSFIQWLGQDKYQKLARFVLKYIAAIEGIPKMTGTFIEFRAGMINVSPVGRNASQAERDEFQEWDKQTHTREKMVEALKKEFPYFGLTYSIGGQISFDVFPTGWDKTFCLQHIENEKKVSGIEYKKIHFFGDKTFKGGNDYEIFEDPRTIGHSVKDPSETLKILKQEFGV